MSTFIRILILFFIVCFVSFGFPFMEGIQFGTKAFGETVMDTFGACIGIILMVVFG